MQKRFADRHLKEVHYDVVYKGTVEHQESVAKVAKEATGSLCGTMGDLSSVIGIVISIPILLATLLI